MNDAEMERLLEQGLSGTPPREEFRERVLRDSLLALARVRRTRTRWRAASLSAAAVLIAGVSFLLGRCSLWAPPTGPVVMTPVGAEASGVTVPNELVAWLDAARLFRQLGMEDRMARAIDHASKWLPDDAAVIPDATGPVVAVGGAAGERQRKDVGLVGVPDLRELIENANRIMAQSSGD